MSLFREILAELIGMFLGDLRLSLGVLAAVGAAALLRALAPELDPPAAGALLLVGCLAVLVFAVLCAARRRR